MKNAANLAIRKRTKHSPSNASWDFCSVAKINFLSSTLFSKPASFVRTTWYGCAGTRRFSVVRPSWAGLAAKIMLSLKMMLCACCLRRKRLPLWCMRPVYQKIDSASVGDCVFAVIWYN